MERSGADFIAKLSVPETAAILKMAAILNFCVANVLFEKVILSEYLCQFWYL